MSLSFKVRGTLSSFPELERILSYRDRPLHGGRGLKHLMAEEAKHARDRPLHGGRGLKPSVYGLCRYNSYRPLHGGRGLKQLMESCKTQLIISPPSRGARIETIYLVVLEI